MELEVHQGLTVIKKISVYDTTFIFSMFFFFFYDKLRSALFYSTKFLLTFIIIKVSKQKGKKKVI
jgi:hypothetical protein